MYAITGITGKVGGELGRRLLASGQSVRAVVRDPAKGAAWAERGCEVAHADMEDGTRLAAAFAGAEAVFILPPSEFDPEPGYPEARRVIDAVVSGLAAARPNRVLCLSTIGADAPHENLLTQRVLLEQALCVEIEPRESWEALFRAQGMRNPLPRIRMLDGFNEGWIKFQEGSHPVRKGTTTLIEVIADLATPQLAS